MVILRSETIVFVLSVAVVPVKKRSLTKVALCKKIWLSMMFSESQPISAIRLWKFLTMYA